MDKGNYTDFKYVMEYAYKVIFRLQVQGVSAPILLSFCIVFTKTPFGGDTTAFGNVGSPAKRAGRSWGGGAQGFMDVSECPP
jgi:hypothetical protein